MENHLAKLVTGHPHLSGDFGDITNHMSSSLKALAVEAFRLPADPESRISQFGPFLGRSLLELAFTVFIGRIDPFRLLVLRKLQMTSFTSATPPIGERFQAAIQWTGDIRAAKDADSPDAWAHTKTMDKFSRSLLGRHYETLFLKEAFIAVVDSLDARHTGPWFDELRSYLPDQFFPWLRAQTDRTYSSLSKGIHQEFVIPPAAFYSPAVVFDLMKDAFRFTCHLALCLNAVPFCQGSLNMNDALESYGEMQNIETTLCLPTP